MNEKADPLEIIFAYTRADALRDGVLVDVSDTAKEAGFRFPTALTSAVWHGFVEVPPGVTGQDEAGRLWDILQCLRFAIRAANKGQSEIRFTVLMQNDNRTPQPVELKSICGPGDNFEPVLTILLPDED